MSLKGKKKQSIWTPIGGWPLFGVVAVGILAYNLIKYRRPGSPLDAHVAQAMAGTPPGPYTVPMDGVAGQGMLARTLEGARW